MFTLRQHLGIGRSEVKYETTPAATSAEKPKSLIDQIKNETNASNILKLIDKIDTTKYTSMNEEDKKTLTVAHEKITQLLDPSKTHEALNPWDNEKITQLKKWYDTEKTSITRQTRRELWDVDVTVKANERSKGKVGGWFTEKQNEEATQSLRTVFDFTWDISKTNVNSLAYALSRIDLATLITNFAAWDGMGWEWFIKLEKQLSQAGYKHEWWLFETSEMQQIKEFVTFLGDDKAKYQKLKTLGTYVGSGKDVEHARKDMEVWGKIDAINVFTFLSDRKAAWVVSAKNNDNIVAERTILEILNRSSHVHSADFYKQLGKLMQSGGATEADITSIKNIDSLVAALKSNVLLKEQFLRGVDKVWAWLSSFLEGPKAFDQYSESRNRSLEEVRKLVEGQITRDTVISGLEKKIWAETNPATKKQFQEMLAAFKKDETSILSQLRYEGMGVLLWSVDGKWILGLGANVAVGDILTLDFWLTIVEGNIMPGIGVHKSFAGKIGENTRGSVTVGIMNIVPYLAWGVSMSTYGNISASDMLESKAKTYGLTANISTVGWGLTGSFRKSAAEAISTNESELRKVLLQFMGIKNITDIDTIDLNKDLPENKKISSEDVKRIKDTIKNDLNVFGIAALPRVLESYVTTLREHQIRNAAKDGYKFSGASAGIQFVAGFFPIPVLGASWEKITLVHARDTKSQAADYLRSLDPKAAYEITEDQFVKLLWHELGDKKASITKNADGTISFKKPPHLNILGDTSRASEDGSGMMTLKKGTTIRTWTKTSSKDVEFNISLEKAPEKLDISKITEKLNGTGITASIKGENILLTQNGKETSVAIKWKEVIVLQQDGKYTITQKDGKADVFTTVTLEKSEKIDILNNQDLTWMSEITGKIYDAKAQNAMFVLRVGHNTPGSAFRKYQDALAKMIKDPSDANVDSTRIALLALTAKNPKSLGWLQKVLEEIDSTEKSKLKFALSKTYDLTLGSHTSHDIWENARKDDASREKAGKSYDKYAVTMAVPFARVWSKAGIAISEWEMKWLMKREEEEGEWKETLAPSTLSRQLSGDVHSIVGFNTIAQMTKEWSWMHGLLPFVWDAPVLWKIWELTKDPALNARIINAIVNKMDISRIPTGIAPDDYKAMLKGDLVAKKKIETAGFTIEWVTKAYFARSGVPGAECTNPVAFITQPRLSKKWQPVTVSATLNPDGISFTGATSTEVNTPIASVTSAAVGAIIDGRSKTEDRVVQWGTETKIDTRDVQVSKLDIKIVEGKQVLVVNSGWNNLNIPFSQLGSTPAIAHQNYVDLISGKTITIPVNTSTLVQLPDIHSQVPVGDLANIGKLALTLSTHWMSFEDIEARRLRLLKEFEDFEKTNK
jgi:hypothetical protein